MAQLKDSVVSGNLRVTGSTLTDTLQTTIIKAPTSSGGTTYGPGTSGQVLKSNGTSVYWGADNNSITGSGTSGYLTKWNGTNSITNGPQLGSSTTTFLRNDGSWATPPNTTYGISGAYGSSNNTWVTTLTAGGTGTTSTVPTATTSVYGITKLYNGVDSTSTGLAATANAVKTAYDKGNHSHPYLPLAGGTMTGVINLVSNKYGDNECGIDCKNSNIVGVNQVKFCDLSDNATEGIMFYRDGTNWDSLWAASGVLYFTPNYSTSTTNNVVLHSGNYTSYGYPLSIAADSGTSQIALSADTTYKLTAGGNSYIFKTPRSACCLSNERTTGITYGANKLEWYDLSGSNGTDVTKKQNPTNDWYHHITMHHANANGYFVDIAACFHSNSIYYRRVATGTDSSSGWVRLIDSSNIGSQTVASAGSATTATTATNANNVYHTLTNPASETTYGVSFFSGISSGNKAMLTNDGIRHVTREGSTSVSGYSIIAMGNDIDNSTAGGKRGYVRLYGAGQYYAQLTPAAATWSSNLDIYIPNKGGTLSVFGTVPGSDGKVIISDGTTGGIKSSGYTIATSVPSGAVFTDTKVTSSANHYTPSTASGSDISKSASGATAAWSIDVVKGITLNTDGKGHVTGLSVTSGKIPANPNTNTTYTLGTSGNSVTLTPSSGSVQSITVPYATNAQYPMVIAGNEIRFFNNNEFALDRHFWFGYQWAVGSRYTPSGSDTPVTGDAALTAPNITKFIMGNCTQGGLAGVHAKSFILGNGTDPTASSATTTITTAATTTGRTITLPDADGTVSLVGHTHSYAGSSSAGGSATSVNTSEASDNVSRVVFFAYNGDTSKVVYDSDFKYNPSTNILTVGNVNGRLYYSGSSCSWWNDRDNAVIRVTTGDTGYRPLWSLITATTGSWAMGNHTGDDLTFNFISKTVYDSKANPSAYKQIKFTADGDIKAQRYLYGTYLNISCGDESSSFASSATILYCLNTSSDNFVRKASLSTIANAAIPAITETGTGTPTDTDYYISQWAGGSASNPVNTTPVKRQHSALWAYINGKISASSSGSGNGVTSVSYANGVITYTKGSTFLTSHQSVSDKNVTLAWGTQKTIATIGSTDIHVTLPSNPNTNTTYTLGTSTDTTVTPNEDTVTLTPSSGSVQSIKVPYAKRAKYVYTDSIGSGAASHAAALQTYFNANKDSINRNSLLGYFSNAEQNGSICMGYFISGYNDNPYGGFFVAHYNTPKYVGISSGTFTQHTLLSNQNYTDYTVKKDGTGATGSWGINITGNAATCTTASEMLTRFTAGTYGTSYALWWGADTTSTDNTSNYARRNGTATIQFRSDTSGWTEIFLGNSTATGNAGSSTGWLGLYSDGTGCHHLSGLTTNSAATHYLPATSGTILNSGTTSFTQTLTSGTKIGEIKINDSSTNIYCSDVNVTQTGVGSTYTNYRPLLISDSSSASAPPGAATVTGGTYITSSIYCQPSSGTVYASKFVGPLQGNADTATKAYTTVTSGTTSIARYGVVFAANSNTSGNESLCKSYDFRLNVTNGSTSADGNCELVIGNGTASGTAGNKQGYITLYSSGQGYHMIGTAATNNAISHTFPASSGTILNTATGLQLSGGTMTGNLKMTEGKNFLLRTHANNTYKAGIGYDTKGNECIALWACNKVTRLRWHAGTDMESMPSGTMMNVANPDFEITKADDQVNPKGFIGKGRIGTTDTLWTSSTTGDTSVAIVIPNSATYLKVWLFNSTASIYTVHEVLIDTTIKTSAVIQTATRGQSGFNLTLSPVTFSLTYTEAVTGAKKYTISVDVGSSIGIINGQYPVLGTQPTVKIVKIMACS